MDRVGVILITGFLGSGKSTLVRRILTENHGLRVVVVENEFADNATVEEAIVTQGVGSDALEDFIELPNGCICCAAQDDLTEALTRLIEKKKGQFDHILVEVSGLADPGPVAASFWIDEWEDTCIQLEAVVTVVDAANILNTLDKNEDDSTEAAIARKQIAMADHVLLNKLDLFSSIEYDPSTDLMEDNPAVSSIIERMRSEGCIAPIEATIKCNIDIAKLLSIKAYDDKSAENMLERVAPTKFDGHLHTGRMNVATVTLPFAGVRFSEKLLDRALGTLLWEQPSCEDEQAPQQIWRMKALVVMHNEENKWIYQSVDTLFDHLVSNVSSQDVQSQFIFIGRHLDKSVLEEHLRNAIHSEDVIQST